MKNIKIGIIVAALGLAAVITYLTHGDQPIADDLSSEKSVWMCSECKTITKLSEREVESECRKLKDSPPLICEKCTLQKLYQVITCPVCETYFFGAEVPGSPGECPKCKPDAVPPPEQEDESSPTYRPQVKSV